MESVPPIFLGSWVMASDPMYLDDFSSYKPQFSLVGKTQNLHPRWHHRSHTFQWEFQDPKMEVLYHIRQYFGGISPYIGLNNRPKIYGRYLQFRILKFPLNIPCDVFSGRDPGQHGNPHGSIHWATATSRGAGGGGRSRGENKGWDPKNGGKHGEHLGKSHRSGWSKPCFGDFCDVIRVASTPTDDR